MRVLSLAKLYQNYSQTKIGKPLYAFAEYEKIKQIGLPLNDNDLLLISLNPDADNEKIIKFVREKMGK